MAVTQHHSSADREGSLSWWPVSTLSEITRGITLSQKAIRQWQGHTNTIWVTVLYRMAALCHKMADEQNGGPMYEGRRGLLWGTSRWTGWSSSSYQSWGIAPTSGLRDHGKWRHLGRRTWYVHKASTSLEERRDFCVGNYARASRGRASIRHFWQRQVHLSLLDSPYAAYSSQSIPISQFSNQK